MLALTACIFAVGLAPSYAVRLLAHAVTPFLPAGSAAAYETLVPAYSTLSLVVLLFALLALALLGLRALLLRGRPPRAFRTWDCGYQASDSRLQYTGSSYAQPFLGLVRELVPQQVRIDRVEGLFPREARLESHAHDVSERWVIAPALAWLNRFMDLFAGVQSGRMQRYIAYGLAFLILILLWIFGGW
jgi:hypothetical protein